MAKRPDDDGLSASLGTRTARTKFFGNVNSAAEASHLELVL